MRQLPKDLPPPAPKPTSQAEAMEALAQARDDTHYIRACLEGFHELAERHDTPAALELPVILDAGQLIQTSRAKHPAKSFGILNPTAQVIYLGVAGASAEPGRRGLTVPPLSLVVLPIAATDIELGVDAATIAGDTAVVFLWRYATVQPAFLGSSA